MALRSRLQIIGLFEHLFKIFHPYETGKIQLTYDWKETNKQYPRRVS